MLPSLVAPTNGMVMLVRLVQFLNAPLPILVTLFGTITLVSSEQPSKAPSCMISVCSFIVQDVTVVSFTFINIKY